MGLERENERVKGHVGRGQGHERGRQTDTERTRGRREARRGKRYKRGRRQVGYERKRRQRGRAVLAGAFNGYTRHIMTVKGTWQELMT